MNKAWENKGKTTMLQRICSHPQDSPVCITCNSQEVVLFKECRTSCRCEPRFILTLSKWPTPSWAEKNKKKTFILHSRDITMLPAKGPVYLSSFPQTVFHLSNVLNRNFYFLFFLVGEGRCLKVKAETLRWQSCGSLLKSLTPRLREAKSCFKRLSIFLARVLRAQRVRVFKHFGSTFASLGLLQLLNCCGFLSLEFKLSVCSEKSKKLDVCFIKPNTHTQKK